MSALLQENLLVCPPQRSAGERRTVRGLGKIIVHRALFLRVCFLCRVWYYGTANLLFYNFIYLFIFYFQIPIFRQEEAAKEMKEKQKKELERLKHLDLSE